MFFKDQRHAYRAIPFEQFEWVEHGFGTRHTDWDGQPVATLRQVHSDRIVTANGAPGCLGEGDALVTDEPGAAVSVRTADCIPILLVEEQKRVVAAVHAGWRGTAASIAAKTVRAMIDRFGGGANAIHAAIGPGIGRCCYQVGREVADQFRLVLPELPKEADRVMLDLTEANRRQLISAGVAADHIYAGAPCTCCTPTEFHSFRRESASAGRMTSAIGIRG